jgi:uncharacterized membrane protein
MDTSTPLYYVLIHYWSSCFGTSEFWLRALSSVFATLSLPIYYLLGRKILVDRLAIVFAMAAFAVSSLQVWYAKEARGYALLVFLSLGSVYFLLLYLENRGLLPFCGIVAFITAALYTHNIEFFYLPGFAILWLIYPAETKLLRRFRDGLLACVAVALSYLPWLPTLRAQLQRQRIHGNFWLAVPHTRDLFDSLCLLSGLDTATLQSAFRNFFHATRLFGFWTWAPGIVALIAVCILGGFYGTNNVNQRKTAAMAIYSLSPILLAFAYSHISGPIYTTRLFLGSCAFLPMLLAAPIAFQVGPRRKWFQALGCLVLLGSVASTVGYLRRERKEDWRGVAEYLQALPEQHRLTIVLPDIGQPLMHYYASRLSISGPPMEVTGLLTKYAPPDVDLERRTLELSDNQNTDPTALLSQQLAPGKYREVDVVTQPGEPANLVEPMLGYLSASCSSTEVKEFHWLQVRRYTIRARTDESVSQ